MQENFTDIAKKIEQRGLKVIKALEQESKNLEKVEQTLNNRYKESVTSVLDSLRSSMEVQGAELIKSTMIKVSSTIEEEMNLKIEQWVKNNNTALSNQRVIQKQISKVQELTLTTTETYGKEMIKKQRVILRKMNINTAMTPIMMVLAFIAGAVIDGYLIKQTPIKVSEKLIVKTKDGIPYIPIEEIPNLKIIKDK